MSKNFQGYMGEQIGKLGPAVGYKFRGKQAYRAYTKNVRNPQTGNQTAVRLQFAVLSVLSRAFAPGIALGLGQYARQRGGYYRPTFSGLNWEAVSASAAGEVTVDHSSLIVAMGGTPVVYFGRANYETPQKVTVPFENNMGVGGALENDTVYLLAYSPTLGTSILSAGNTRASGQAEIALPAEWSGESIHLYGFVRNSLLKPTWVEALQTTLEPGVSSTSTYLGEGTIG